MDYALSKTKSLCRGATHLNVSFQDHFHSTVMPANIFWKIVGRAVCTSSEIVRNGSVKSAALAKLRRAHSNAAAVAQFVNLVE